MSVNDLHFPFFPETLDQYQTTFAKALLAEEDSVLFLKRETSSPRGDNCKITSSIKKCNKLQRQNPQHIDLMIYKKNLNEEPLEEFHLNLIHDILVCLDKG